MLLGNSHTHLISMFPVNDNQWHHIAVLRNNLDEMYMYVDGVVVDQVQGNSGTVCEGPNQLSIGSSALVGGIYQNALSGNLDNLRIWTKALNQNEIIQYMNQCKVNDPDLELYYNFDEIVNYQFIDETNNYNASITGILNTTIDTISPLCCDCEIFSLNNSFCIGDNVTLYSESEFSLLWSDGSADTSLFTALNDTSVQLYFLDSRNYCMYRQCFHICKCC